MTFYQLYKARDFGNFLERIYPNEFEIEETSDTRKSA